MKFGERINKPQVLKPSNSFSISLFMDLIIRENLNWYYSGNTLVIFSEEDHKIFPIMEFVDIVTKKHIKYTVEMIGGLKKGEERQLVFHFEDVMK